VECYNYITFLVNQKFYLRSDKNRKKKIREWVRVGVGRIPFLFKNKKFIFIKGKYDMGSTYSYYMGYDEDGNIVSVGDEDEQYVVEGGKEVQQPSLVETSPETNETSPAETNETSPAETKETSPAETKETSPVETKETSPAETKETSSKESGNDEEKLRDVDLTTAVHKKRRRRKKKSSTPTPTPQIHLRSTRAYSQGGVPLWAVAEYLEPRI
jgi:hypothetical protein